MSSDKGALVAYTLSDSLWAHWALREPSPSTSARIASSGCLPNFRRPTDSASESEARSSEKPSRCFHEGSSSLKDGEVSECNR